MLAFPSKRPSLLFIMKALVLERYNELVYGDVPRPSLGAEDVLIRVKGCGICGSDVHGMDGSSGRRQPPIIMGHEAAGVIEEIGAAVKDWRPGDRVTFDSTVSCGSCPYCRSGRVNLCDHRRVLGVSCDEYRWQGAFAEYVAVPQRILYRLPDALSFEEAVMVEPLSIAFHAVNLTPIKLNDAAVVVGAGMIGLLVIQALRLAGCGQILAIDLEKEKLALALEFGANQAIDASKGDPVEEVLRLTGGRGVHMAFEAAGFAETVDIALRSVVKGGHITLVGNLSKKIQWPLAWVVTRELTVAGSCASAGEYPACLDMIAQGRINVKRLISQTAPLSQGPALFQRLYQKEKGLLKVILVPDWNA